MVDPKTASVNGWITIRCTRSRGPRGFFCLHDFRRGPVNVAVIQLSLLNMNLDRLHNLLQSGTPAAPMGYDDFFARTWQCSHVRFCRGLWDADDYSPEEALAWILKRNESDYVPRWLESVASSALRSIDIEEIRSSIGQTVTEIDNSDHIANPPMFPLSLADLTDVTSASMIDRLSLYDYGPTVAYVWQRSCEFNYMELHYES